MKAEKPGAIIYYKHLEILEEAELSDEQIGMVLRAAIKYDETGVCPKFTSPLSAFFTMIKYDLDANRRRYEEIKQERSRVGKLGGRPPKKAKKPIGNGESKNTNSFTSAAIKDEARNIGFFLDEAKAQSFCDCGLDPGWLQGPHSFLALAAERVLENAKYRDLPPGEQKALFISAVKTWEELRDEYPGWRNKKETQDRNAAIKAARENRPANCRCGGKLVSHSENELFCLNCRGVTHRLDEASAEWVYQGGPQ